MTLQIIDAHTSKKSQLMQQNVHGLSLVYSVSCAYYVGEQH